MSGKVASEYERALLEVVRELPAERVAQVLDYARYIRSRAAAEWALLDDETEEEILADEARWDARFAATQDSLKKAADAVRADISAGRTSRMREL